MKSRRNPMKLNNIISFVLLLAGPSLFASAKNENNLALETLIIRQVIEQALLKEADAKYNENLTRAIEGPGDSTFSDEIKSISCSTGLSVVRCFLSFTTKNTGDG